MSHKDIMRWFDLLFPGDPDRQREEMARAMVHLVDATSAGYHRRNTSHLNWTPKPQPPVIDVVKPDEGEGR